MRIWSLSTWVILFIATRMISTSVLADNTSWTDGAGNDLWSAPGNWSGGILPGGNDVYFYNTGITTTGSVTNIIDGAYNINSLTCTMNHATHVMELLPDSSLTVSNQTNIGTGSGDPHSWSIFEGPGTLRLLGSTMIANGAIDMRNNAKLEIYGSTIIGYAANYYAPGYICLSSGASMQMGTALQPIDLTLGYSTYQAWNVYGILNIDSSQTSEVSMYLRNLDVGLCNGGSAGIGQMDISKYTGALSISNSLNVGAGRYGGGTASYFSFDNRNLSVPYVNIGNGSVNVGANGTLEVTKRLILGYTNEGWTNANLNFANGAGLNIGSAANPAEMSVTCGRGNATTVFAPNSSTNPNMALYFSNLNIATDETGTGTVDLTNYTGPLSIGSLNIGAVGYRPWPGGVTGYSGKGHFIFGNSVNNRLSFQTLTIANGDITVRGGASLNVTQDFYLGYGSTYQNTSGALNLDAGAKLHVGTATNPANMYVAYGGGNTTAQFAPDSSTNPDITLHLLSLNVGTGKYSDGTVDLSKYTGTLNVQNLNIGAVGYDLWPGGVTGYSGRGHFIFGNSVNNRLSFQTLTISNGDITVRSGSTLDITQNFYLGYSSTYQNTSGALNLDAGAKLHVGTATNPANMYVAYGGGNTTAQLAPDSSKNPNMALYLSSLNIATGATASGTVDLSKYRGPLSIGNLNVGSGSGGVGHFAFGNSTLKHVDVSSVSLSRGDMTLNTGAEMDITGGLSIASMGQLFAHMSGRSSGVSLENASAGALSLGSGADRMVLNFDGWSTTSGPYWGFRWLGNHISTLTSYLDDCGFAGNGAIGLTVGTTRLDPERMTVALMTENGLEYTYIGFADGMPEFLPDRFYAGGYNGQWDTLGNWKDRYNGSYTDAPAPTSTNPVFINKNSVAVNHAGAAAQSVLVNGGKLTIDGTTGGALTVAQNMELGNSTHQQTNLGVGQGWVKQLNGGQVTVNGDLIVGGQDSVYEISDNSRLNVLGDVTLAAGTNALFHQKGGTVVIGSEFDALGHSTNGLLDLGEGTTYQMDAGTLDVATIHQTGMFVFNGGSLYVKQFLINTTPEASAPTYVVAPTPINSPATPAAAAAAGGGSGGCYVQPQGGFVLERGIVVLDQYSDWRLEGENVNLTIGKNSGGGSNGNFLQSGGNVNVDGSLIIGDGLGGKGSYAMSGGALTVHGQMVLGRDGGIGYFDQTGGAVNVDGWVVITESQTGYSMFNITDGTLQALGLSIGENGGPGELHIGTNASVHILENVVIGQNGKVTGSGIFDVTGASVVNNGLIEPGNSPGQITFNANYTQGALGVLHMEFAGRNIAGVDYDQLIIDGNVILQGKMILDFIDGNAPAAGDIYTLILMTNGHTVLSDVADLNIEVVGLQDGWEYNLYYDAVTNAIVLNSINNGVAVPEPATMGLLFIGVILWRRNKNR